MASLEQLELSAACPLIDSNDWLINHDIIRTHLCRLPNLKKLAFYWDTYTPLDPSLTVDLYYAKRRPYVGDYEAARSRPDLDGDLGEAIDSMPGTDVWELSHRNRMLAEAEKYAGLMPNLEWMYFGRIPIGFKKVQSKTVRAVPLWPKMDDCITVLSEMFVH